MQLASEVNTPLNQRTNQPADSGKEGEVPTI
jgi:hypothetical protein